MSLKNTYYLILLLSVLAALLIGLNIGKKLEKPAVVIQSPTPTPLLPETPYQSTASSDMSLESSGSANLKNASVSGVLKGTVYTNAACGISLTYPDTLQIQESSTEPAGVLFTGKSNPNEIVVLSCQKDIPTPPLASGSIEEKNIGTVKAKLYHDTSPKDGTKTDALIFTHPKTQLDIFIAGYGATYNSIIQSLKIL